MKNENIKKKVSIFALALSCCAFTTVGAITAAATDETPATITVENVAGNFEMVAGASVRLSDTKPGIRFTTKISEAYYNACKTAYGDDFTLATKISIDKADTDAQILPCTSSVVFDEGWFTYHAAMTFEGLTETQLDEAIEWQMTGVGVVLDLVEGNATVMQTAVATDNTRSMKAVANVAKLDGEDEDGLLDTYVDDATVGATSFYDLSADNTTVDVAIDVEDGEYSDAYVGSKKVALTVADGKTTVNASDFVGVGEGELGYVSVFTGDEIKASPVRFATKLIKTQDDLNKVLLSDTTVTGYYVLMDDINVSSWSNTNDKGKTRDNHYNMQFDGVFEGNGKTITAKPCRNGVFGSLKGTVQNLNVVFNVSGNILQLGSDYNIYANEQTLISSGGSNLGVIKNLNVSLTGTANVMTQGFSLLGNASYKSVENVVANYGSIVPSTFVDGLTKYGLLFATGSNAETIDYIKDVYILSSTLDVLLTDGTNSYYASNATGEELKTIAGVKHYEDGQDMATDYANLDLSGFDSAWWDTTSGLPMWKATADRDDFTVWMIDGTESAENTIPLSKEKTTAEIELNYGVYADLDLTFTVSPADSGVVEIGGKTITAKKDGTVTVTATAEKNGVTISKDFTVVVAITPVLEWTGDNLIWSTTDVNLIMPTEMGALADVQSITNLTDGATVYDGTTWTGDSLANVAVENANVAASVISKQLRIVFADKAYDATVDCYTQAITSDSVMNTVFQKNKKVYGSYILANDITVNSWKNAAAGSTATYHYNMNFYGLFEGNGKTITTIPVYNSIFGSLFGTVQNLNLVVNVTSSTIAAYTAASGNNSQNLVASGTAYGRGVIENLNVKLTGTAGAATNGFSLFGASGYKSLKNIVVDCGDIVPTEFTASTSTAWGLMFNTAVSTTSANTNTVMENVYIVSSGLKLIAFDGTNAYSASNDTIDGATQIAGVKRYDSWALLAADYTSYDASFWGKFTNN